MALTAHSDPPAHTPIRKMGKENGCFPVISKRQRLMSSLQVAKCECSGFGLVETHSLQPHTAVKVPLEVTPADLEEPFIGHFNYFSSETVLVVVEITQQLYLGWRLH